MAWMTISEMAISETASCNHASLITNKTVSHGSELL